jgi:hypothetical protein
MHGTWSQAVRSPVKGTPARTPAAENSIKLVGNDQQDSPKNELWFVSHLGSPSFTCPQPHKSHRVRAEQQAQLCAVRTQEPQDKGVSGIAEPGLCLVHQVQDSGVCGSVQGRSHCPRC